MALEITDKGKFVYITYARQGIKDIEQFRTVLMAEMSKKESTKDIIIDFGASKYLTSPEIGILVRLANGLVGSPRIVRVVPSDDLYKKILAININRLDHLKIYKNRQEFSEQLKGALGA